MGLYIHGYSHGAQTAWVDRTLAGARRDPEVDWIIVFFHQPVMSSSSFGAGGDLGLRRTFMPLFDEYGVDLALCGHDHDYERTYLVKGTDPGTELRPTVVSQDTATVDTDGGHLHLVIGGGGTSGHDDVDPGDHPGGRTTISVSFYHTPPATVAAPFPAPVLFDRFTLTKTRSDGFARDGFGGRGRHDRDRVPATR